MSSFLAKDKRKAKIDKKIIIKEREECAIKKMSVDKENDYKQGDKSE